jgi:hypothetical protein
MSEPVGWAELHEAARGGHRKNTQASKTTIGMRMGHLSAFFNRIIEWDYPDAPAPITGWSAARSGDAGPEGDAGRQCSPPIGRSRFDRITLRELPRFRAAGSCLS